MRSLFSTTYFPKLLKIGVADDLRELKTFDRDSTKPFPVICFFRLEYPYLVLFTNIKYNIYFLNYLIIKRYPV